MRRKLAAKYVFQSCHASIWSQSRCQKFQNIIAALSYFPKYLAGTLEVAVSVAVEVRATAVAHTSRSRDDDRGCGVIVLGNVDYFLFPKNLADNLAVGDVLSAEVAYALR